MKKNQNGFSIESMNYRADIDGLRAVAVLMVILYHFFPASFPGGYLGVDVFFVISGFLITRIVVHELQQGHFSFSNFYKRRLNRLFPALILMLLTVFIWSFIWLLPDERLNLSRHIKAAAFYFSNFQLIREAGYFDASSLQKPLLHLWSLAIEEQFYLIWPVLIFFTFKRAQKFFLQFTLILFVISFLAFVWMSLNSIDQAFYLPWFRSWELLAGAALAFAGKIELSQRLSRPLSLLSISALLSFCFIAFSSSQFFWLPHLLTVGFSVLLICSANSFFNLKILSNPVAVYIGKISYPLYLWHWPVLVFSRFGMANQIVTRNQVLVEVVLSLLLSVLTYHVVEKKYIQLSKKEPHFFGFKSISKPVFLLTFLCILGLSAKPFSIEFSKSRLGTFASEHLGADLPVTKTDWMYPSENVPQIEVDPHTWPHYLLDAKKK